MLASLLALSLPVISHADTKKPLEWQITNTAWTPAFEKSYGEFIAAMGKAKRSGICGTTNDCLKSPKANPRYFNSNPDNLKQITADCADLPYVLRAYFSWMNNLPFSYPLDVEPAKNSDGSVTKDVRYSRNGNVVTSKRIVKSGMNFNTVLTEVTNNVSTASFRTNASNNATNALFRDTYPVAISRTAIVPGTMLYDANGHVAVVYEVATNGKIFLMDAHPDNSLTTITYGEKFARTQVEIGGGFSNWRPFSFDNGTLTVTPNGDLPEYSVIQYQSSSAYVFNNKKVSFHEYVRNKLTGGALVYRPVQEVSELIGEICNDMKEREVAVNLSLAANIQNKDQPTWLPDNIYGTDGEWESFSSPSRDARLKASIREGRSLILKMIQGYKNSDSSIKYDGVNLIRDMRTAYLTAAKTCYINVKKTNGTTLKLTLHDILENIYKLSFDPYHCAELRWGLTDAESLKSCNQPKIKLDWYKAEQGLRNRIDRDYSMITSYTIYGVADAEVSQVKQEDISIDKVLK